ncbi:tenascin-R-like [Haliotis rufescens]|uniref:tenascin-R-like n=1 Tax=Haliotis rufescens TaxID=6454 RepID=UPI00201ED701|nr:tenascin-R-like [Haliotis rufescens]
MFAAPLCGLLMALLLAAPISANLSAISLTSTTDNLDLAFAWKVMEAHTLSSRVLCASMCERKAWCVAVALCQQSSTPLMACGLVTVNVTLNVMHSDDLSHCRVHYSKKRLENLVSCGASHSPDLALSPCSTTTTTTTTPSPASGTTECVTDLGGGCDCPAGATNINCTTFISDCPSHWRTWNTGGVYTLQVADYPTPFQVYCDGSAITIQRRKDCGDEFFFRDWQAYRDGFGDINSECFWLGNKKIKAITDQGEYTLYVKPRQRSYVSKYKNFRLSSEEEGYAMEYSAFSSSGWMKADYKDGFGGGPSNTRLQGMKFYTHDKDNTAGCASNRKSGWWYNTECAFGDLNQDEAAEWPDSESGELTEYDDVLMKLYDYHY